MSRSILLLPCVLCLGILLCGCEEKKERVVEPITKTSEKKADAVKDEGCPSCCTPISRSEILKKAADAGSVKSHGVSVKSEPSEGGKRIAD